MARKEGLRPIGESLKPIIERIKKEREERRKKNKPIRTQPKLPGMKKGGSMENPKKVDRIVDRIKSKKNPEDVLRRALSITKEAAGLGALGAVPGVAAGLGKLGRAARGKKSKDPNKDKRSPGRPGGRGKKEGRTKYKPIIGKAKDVLV